MATQSSILAWRIPGMGEPGGLPSMGSHRVGHDWSDLAAAAGLICLSICLFVFWRKEPINITYGQKPVWLSGTAGYKKIKNINMSEVPWGKASYVQSNAHPLFKNPPFSISYVLNVKWTSSEEMSLMARHPSAHGTKWMQHRPCPLRLRAVATVLRFPQGNQVKLSMSLQRRRPNADEGCWNRHWTEQT